MNDSVIGRLASVDQSILDKNVVVGAGAVVGYGDDFTPNRQQPRALFSGLTVLGRGTHIPDRLHIGRNCILGSDLADEDFSGGVVRSGDTIPSRRRTWWMETAARR